MLSGKRQNSGRLKIEKKEKGKTAYDKQVEWLSKIYLLTSYNYKNEKLGRKHFNILGQFPRFKRGCSSWG